MSEIKLLKRKDVDEQKWNNLVNGARFSLPYALTWYLDAVAENWDALVWKDYEAVMPLVWLRKMGVKCLYQPYYCQQLGVFGKAADSESLQSRFLTEAKKFAYVNINLNPSSAKVARELNLKPKRNLLLNLNLDYTVLRKAYSDNHKRNIAKAIKGGQHFAETVEVESFQKFYLENVNRKKENFKPQHEKIFKGLTQTLVHKQVGQVYAAQNYKGDLTAALMLLRHKNRIINVINTSSAEGKRSGASHFLFDALIQKFAGNELVFDFEGSSITSIAKFYEGFGPCDETFYNYHTTIIKRASQLFR